MTDESPTGNDGADLSPARDLDDRQRKTAGRKTMPAKLRVDVIAESRANMEAMRAATDGAFDPDGDRGADISVYAGRACYQSWSKPNPATADSAGYLRHIIEVAHFSVMRHAVVTVYIQGVSRSLTHELIRHHVGIDYSQLSQRYVASENMDYVIPPAMRDSEEAQDRLEQHWRTSVRNYEMEVSRLENKGVSRKQARETARAFLPNCAETKILVTGNMQAWRNFIKERATIQADAEIRELAVELARIFKAGAPEFFPDMSFAQDAGGPVYVAWE